MDQVTLFTVSHADRQAAVSAPIANILRRTAPAFLFDERFQRAFDTISVTLYLQSQLLAAATLYASRILAVQAYFATTYGASLSGRLLLGVWDSKTVRALRKKMFEDFAKWILGSGNVIFLALFWPGWWIIGCTALAVLQFAG